MEPAEGLTAGLHHGVPLREMQMCPRMETCLCCGWKLPCVGGRQAPSSRAFHAPAVSRCPWAPNDPQSKGAHSGGGMCAPRWAACVVLEGVCPSAEPGKPSRSTGSSQGRAGGCPSNKSKLHIKGLKISPKTPAPVRFPDFLQNGPTVQCSLPYQTAGHRLQAPPAAGARRQRRACLVVHAPCACPPPPSTA